jgi:hypothetical protein
MIGDMHLKDLGVYGRIILYFYLSEIACEFPM